MPKIQLLDGKKIDFDKAINGFDLTKKISKSLEKAALIMEVDGDLKDLSHEITKDAKVRIITPKDKEGLEVIRHDTAHILAMAVQELYPGTQVTIGPVIDNGFYYDFSRKEPFTEEDLKKIEKKMGEIVDRDEKTYREVWKRDKAIKHFSKIGEKYKAEIIESIPAGEEVSIYHHGKWHDLCRGPHLASTGKIGKAFKLTKVSGAYWRGDSNNEMLQRIYGTCWSSKKELEQKNLEIETSEINEKLKNEKIDVTLPIRPYRQGRVHPVSQVIDEISSIFSEIGFSVAEGPDVETEYNNFTALNTPANHPARDMHDTFYLEEGKKLLLRTHTSPVQIRTMMSGKAPFKIIAPGRTYRCDSDQTHAPMFCSSHIILLNYMAYTI